jgi:hypothetical protein
VMRLADQVGLTPAGLRENGWKVATDEIGARRAEMGQASEGEKPPVPKTRASGAALRQRMQVVSTDGA